ncbi:hypothetical protein BKA56DRAFT_224318 [Ilyonectria sp. MPI-CAGE-AT-0026]|nr:hypothetical protein BKA56DRAFT_224318 [Ilyonectria sp. MPI-CAGE-AT-0026]
MQANVCGCVDACPTKLPISGTMQKWEVLSCFALWRSSSPESASVRGREAGQDVRIGVSTENGGQVDHNQLRDFVQSCFQSLVVAAGTGSKLRSSLQEPFPHACLSHPVASSWLHADHSVDSTCINGVEKWTQTASRTMRIREKEEERARAQGGEWSITPKIGMAVRACQQGLAKRGMQVAWNFAGDKFGGSEGDMGREPNKREPREEGTKR